MRKRAAIITAIRDQCTSRKTRTALSASENRWEVTCIQSRVEPPGDAGDVQKLAQVFQSVTTWQCELDMWTTSSHLMNLKALQHLICLLV